jgi:hypothetical protein
MRMRSLPMIAGCWGRGMMAGMRQLADEAETVITAKIAEDFGRAVTDPSLAAATACFGRTTVTRLAALPGHSAYNKARGFNIDDVDHLPAICAFFVDAGLPPLIEVWAGDASATLGRRLGHAGFYAAEVNVTLQAEPGRCASTTAPGHGGIAVREMAASDDDTVYLDTLFQAYGLYADSVSIQQTMMAIEHRSPHLRRYLAYVDRQPAAAAALYTTPAGAYFSGAATVPAMRNRGCQSALIRRRLHDAAATAHPVVVTTAFGSPSQANLQRFGFHIVHTRSLWRPLAATE